MIDNPTELLAFLDARLDDDQQIAQAAEALGARWQYDTDHGWVMATREGDAIATGSQDFLDPERGHHIARHDPARTLATVASTRALIVDLHTDPHGDDEYSSRFRCGATEDDYGNRLDPDDVARRTRSCTCGRDERVYRRIRLLAMPYASHPDYREEWRL